MASRKVQLCSYCRLLFTSAHRSNVFVINRKWLLQHLPVVSRTLSTSSSLYQDKGASLSSSGSSSGSSSESSSDSDTDVKGRTIDEVDVQNKDLSTSSLLAKLRNADLNPISVKTADPSRASQIKEPIRAKQSQEGAKDSVQKEASTVVDNKPEQVIDPSIVSAAKSVAESLPGDKVETESMLLGKLLSQMETTVQQKRGQSPGEDVPAKEKTFSDVMEGISIMKKKQERRPVRGPDQIPSTGRTQRAHQMTDDYDDASVRVLESPRQQGLGLLSGKPLGIFSKTDAPQESGDQKKSLFDIVEEERKLRATLSFAPRNAFEEQIQWTREGKLWNFPIDNEAGWEEEKAVGFHEHIFLEQKLTDFPKKGPIRHFMELVTTALSKNPYLTVQQKHEHIDWYKQYFIQKQEMLEERLGESGRIRNEQAA